MLNRIEQSDWLQIATDLDEKGYAQIKSILTGEQCNNLIDFYNNDNLYRKTISMERYHFGKGEYKYFNYPLPFIVQQLRETIYSNLAQIANNWMKLLKIDIEYPTDLGKFLAHCHSKNQLQPTPLILKYEKGGFNTLHQDMHGEIYFPIQVVLFLNELDKEYTGGEFVMIEQKPRAQSKAIVLNATKGDMLIFTTNFRPVKGKNAYYRVNMKHGVSEVRAGIRHTMGIIFHDAA